MENYRPLKMLHGYNYDGCGNDLEKKKQAIKKRIDDLHQKGYGGIVTNVEWDELYLQSDENWELLRCALSYATNQYNMKIWLYDEKAYPSGGAGGLTLAENPEFECKGLALVRKDAAQGEEIILEKPRGHQTVQAVYAIDEAGSIRDLASQTDSSGTVRFRAERPCRIYYFVTKPLYEGTHAQHNTCASRRYISLTDKNAVQAFIRNTYQAYADHLAGLDLPEDSIQAFFTDEPSLQACYLNEGLNPDNIADPVDPELPLYPVIAWENGICELYLKRYGEALPLHLHELFEGDGRNAKITRYQYYSLISDLYEDAFFRQISEFCIRHGIAFSGHLLLEENLLHHALFEGNYFNLARHMQIPGIDMLFTKPENILRFAETPKLLSSVASWYGRKHVMSEVSGHTENALGIPFDIHDIVCAQLAQFVLGVDIFNSYFDDDVLTEEENKLLCGSIAAVTAEFSEKRSMSDVILYYPIESAQVSLKGSDRQLYDRPYDKEALACEESWRGMIDTLLRNHYMFDCADETVLAGAEISKEECCVKNPASGIAYHAIVVPRLAAVTSSALELFRQCADCGIPVILNDLSPAVTVLGADSEEAGRNAVIRLISAENVINVPSGGDALQSLKYLLPPEIELSGDDGAVIALAKKDPVSDHISYLAVNTSSEAKTVTVTVDVCDTLPAGIRCIDPITGTETELAAVSAAGERYSVSVSIDALGARILKL